MRTQPRQEILDIWKAVAKFSWSSPDKKWIWGGRLPANSIGDAEQLLCILLPATQLQMFALDNPNVIGDAMVESLRPIAGRIDIPTRLIEALLTYYETYTEDGVRPVFAGGAYFSTADGSAPTGPQKNLDVVDSFAMSITLSLATIGFLRVYRNSTGNEGVIAGLNRLETLASTRLTAAMVGLLRSFSVNVFEIESDYGSNLMRTINQARLPPAEVTADFQNRLRRTTVSFREILIGSGQVTEEILRPDRLWECGWSWGIVENAPPIGDIDAAKIGTQVEGVAKDLPWLYFTAVAMDAIEDLFSERTRVLGLLNEDQQRLARALQLRADFTQAYWATVATFDSDPQWPIEDVPWRTTDGEESDYYSLQVTSLAVRGLLKTRKSDVELRRIGEVLRELANRARITRRPSADDPSMVLHKPGHQLNLLGSDKDGTAVLTWHVNEFAPLLMQRIVSVAGLLSDGTQRSHMLDLADRVWEHLQKRRTARESLWDRPAGAFPRLEDTVERPSWYFTERVVQALVQTALTLDPIPLRSERISGIASDLVSEADHLYDRLQLQEMTGAVLSADVKWIGAMLRRAREAMDAQPGTAAALAFTALVKLNDLAVSAGAASEGV